jgi:O-antigen ligase
MSQTVLSALALYRATIARTGIQLFLPLSVLPLAPIFSLAPLITAGLLLAITDEQEPGTKKRKGIGLASVLVAAFLLSFIVSVATSVDFLDSLESLLILFPAALLVVLCAELNSSPHALSGVSRGVVYMVFSGCGLVVIIWCLDPGTGATDLFLQLHSSALVVPNDVLYAVIAMPIVIYVAIFDDCWLHKTIALISIGLCLLVVAIVDSRSCLLAAALGLGVFLYLRHPLLLLPIVLLGLAGLFLLDQLHHYGFGIAISEVIRSNERLSLWYLAFTRVTEHLLPGFGPGQFEFVYENYMHVTQFPEGFQIDNRHTPWVHNLYIEALIERGAIGFTALLLLLTHMLYRTRSSLESNRPSGNYAQAVFVSFAIFLFCGALELTLQRSWVVIFFALYIAYYLSIDLQEFSLNSLKQKNRNIALNSLALIFLVLGLMSLGSERDKEDWTTHACSILVELRNKTKTESTEFLPMCQEKILGKIKRSPDISNPDAYWQISARQRAWTPLETFWWYWSDWSLFVGLGLSFVLLRLVGLLMRRAVIRNLYI